MTLTSTTGKRRVLGKSGGGIKARGIKNLYIGCKEVHSREFSQLMLFEERCGREKRLKSAIKSS